MSGGPIIVRPFGPAGAAPLAEEQTARFRRHHAESLQQVHEKQSLRRFVLPLHPQPSRRHGARFTEADLDAFLRSLDRRLMPAALAKDPEAQAIGLEFWAARQSCATEIGRRIREERGGDEVLLAAVEHAIVRALLVRDRSHLLNFVGMLGVEAQELALALWSSHAHGWYALATDRTPLWPRVEGWLAGVQTQDRIERSHAQVDRFGGGPPRFTPMAPKAGLRLYQALLKPKDD